MYDPAAYTGPQGQQDKVAEPPARAAFFLAEGRDIGIIFDKYRQIEPAAYLSTRSMPTMPLRLGEARTLPLFLSIRPATSSPNPAIPAVHEVINGLDKCFKLHGPTTYFFIF